jgi:cobalt-zinc-cadmium efflux system outer membrane protein
MHRPFVLLATAVLLMVGMAPAARAESPFADTTLATLIWQQNPDVRQTALAEAQAEAELRRQGQLPNPTIDVGQVSVPLMIGAMPEGTDFFHAPAQFLGVTQPFDLVKRPFRLSQAQAGLRQAQWQTIATHKQRTADLLVVAVRLAVARLRVQLMQEQTDAVRELVGLTALTAKQGFAAPLDYEKLLLEQGRMQMLYDGARVSLNQARSDWTSLTLQPPPELDERAAEALVDRLAQLPTAWPDVERQLRQVPQRQVLLSQDRQAADDMAIARRLWVPDLGVRVAYTYDTLPTGNIPHSVAWSVTAPIPVFQAGQAEAMEAEGRLATATMALDALDRNTRLSEAALRSRAELVHHTLVTLEKERLPAARATMTRLQTALKARGIPLTDLIQVRRTYLDMEGIRVDLLEQLSTTLVDYRRLLAWQLPDPPVSRPTLPPDEESR